MFSLVLFTGRNPKQIEIVNSENVKPKEDGSKVLVKWTNGRWYVAKLIKTSDDKASLEGIEVLTSGEIIEDDQAVEDGLMMPSTSGVTNSSLLPRNSEDLNAFNDDAVSEIAGSSSKEHSGEESWVNLDYSASSWLSDQQPVSGDRSNSNEDAADRDNDTKEADEAIPTPVVADADLIVHQDQTVRTSNTDSVSIASTNQNSNETRHNGSTSNSGDSTLIVEKENFAGSDLANQCQNLDTIAPSIVNSSDETVFDETPDGVHTSSLSKDEIREDSTSIPSSSSSSRNDQTTTLVEAAKTSSCSIPDSHQLKTDEIPGASGVPIEQNNDEAKQHSAAAGSSANTSNFESRVLNSDEMTENASSSNRNVNAADAMPDNNNRNLAVISVVINARLSGIDVHGENSNNEASGIGGVAGNFRLENRAQQNENVAAVCSKCSSNTDETCPASTSVEGMIELVEGSGVLINERQLNRILGIVEGRSSILLRRLLDELLGQDRLTNMRATGKEGWERIPEEILQAVEDYVIEHANGRMTRREFRRLVTKYLSSLRTSK